MKSLINYPGLEYLYVANTLGEGPVWDTSRSRILWIDILEKEIHQYFPNQDKHLVLPIDKTPGAIALTDNDDLLLAAEDGCYLLNTGTGKLTMWAEIELSLKGNRLNDGKCDPAGRFWTGSMSTTGEPGAGNLYMLDNEGNVSLKVRQVTCSNGMAWSPDLSTFYYIDTPTRQVNAYKYEVGDGKLTDKACVITIPSEEGKPDGLTVDSSGMLWIALWDGGKIIRVDPQSGRTTNSFALPVSRVTSCIFGGRDLQDLYITTARWGLTRMELAAQPLAGSLFVLKDTGYRGLSSFNYTSNHYGKKV